MGAKYILKPGGSVSSEKACSLSKHHLPLAFITDNRICGRQGKNDFCYYGFIQKKPRTYYC